MASLINDKATLLKFVKIGFINDVSSMPDFNVAADRFLIPIIGQTLYDALIAEIESDPEVIDDIDLVNKCRAVVAPLAYLTQLAVIQAQITDSGIKTTNTENLQAAHRWEYNEVKEHLADAGAFAIENLLYFLFANKGDYDEWTGSEQYTDINSLIIKTAAEFNKLFTVSQPYRVWWDLRPTLLEVQDLFIKSTIGEEFFNELNEEEDPDDNQKHAILLIKKAAAQFTIVKAIEKRSVRFSSYGFTTKVNGATTESPGADEERAPDNLLSALYNGCENAGNSYLIQLQEFLNKTASDTVFETYKDSQFYTPPSTIPEESKNANRKGTFGL